MKQIWPNYSYSPTTNVLTLTGLNIDRDQLLLVSAPERGRIMYNFADSTVTASAFTAGANTGLTLVASTAGLTTTAALVIYYDDQVAGISGTVTANLGQYALTGLGGIASDDQGYSPSQGVQIGYTDDENDFKYVDSSHGLPVSGTVTASLVDVTEIDGDAVLEKAIGIGYNSTDNGEFRIVSNNYPLPIQGIISGTVTANVGNPTDIIGGGYSNLLNLFDNELIQIGSLPPISGTVTIGSALPAGTNRIGVVTIGAGTVTIGAGTAQIGSVTASISGTVPISISSVTIGNFPATQAISIASVTVGNSVTIGSLPAISGTVTANIAISSTAITSGSFTSLTSATLVPANTARKMATVYNLGPGQLFVNAGATATTLGGGFMVALSSSDYLECGFTTTTLSAIFATAGTASWVSH